MSIPPCRKEAVSGGLGASRRGADFTYRPPAAAFPAFAARVQEAPNNSCEFASAPEVYFARVCIAYTARPLIELRGRREPIFKIMKSL
jgi:hypothetical protein